MTTEKKEFCLRSWKIMNHRVRIGDKVIPIAAFAQILKSRNEICVLGDISALRVDALKARFSQPEYVRVYENAFVRVSADYIELWVKGDTPMPEGTVLAVAASSKVEFDEKSKVNVMTDTDEVHFYACPKHLISDATTSTERREALACELTRLITYLQWETKYPMLEEGEERTLFTPFINTTEPSDADIHFIKTVGGSVIIESIVRSVLSRARETLLSDECQIVPAAINALHRSGFETSYITYRRHGTRVLVLYIHTGYGRILVHADGEAIKNCYDVTFEKAHNKAPKDFNSGGFIDRLLRWLNK